MRNQILTAFTLLTLSSSLVMAQSHTPPTAAQMVTNKVARLTTLLTLTAAQQTQATTIFTNEQTAASGIMTNMKTARTALQTAVQKNDTAGIASQSTTIGNLTTQLTETQAEADAAFYAILMADQQTKYASLPGGGAGFGAMNRFRGGPR